jgi:hypothetical protein
MLVEGLSETDIPDNADTNSSKIRELLVFIIIH